VAGPTGPAARLFGAAAAARRETGEPRLPFDRPPYERDLAATRAALSADAFAGAWAEGQAMSLEQAVADALADAGDGLP
jgi:hypothetical protein